MGLKRWDQDHWTRVGVPNIATTATANDINNDSNVTGAKVKDALNTLNSGKVDNSTTVNGKPLSSNVSLDGGDINLDNTAASPSTIKSILDTQSEQIVTVAHDIAPEYNPVLPSYSAYDATATYAVGAKVIYSGSAYECITAITTAEAWTAAHWKVIPIYKVGDFVTHETQLYRCKTAITTVEVWTSGHWTAHSVSMVIGTLGYVTPEMFGAVGDGVTDDSQAITQASTCGKLIGTRGKKYRIKTDTYIVNDSDNLYFVIDDTKIIRFNKENTIHKNLTFEVPLEEVQRHSGRGSSCTYINKNDITFINCKWIRGTNFLSLYGVKNVTIDKCTFWRAYQTAYNEGGNGYAILITDCCENVKITNSIFKSIGRHCIYISKDIPAVQSNKYIIIENNYFDWSNVNNEELPVQGLGSNYSIQFRYAEHCVVKNNYFNAVDGAIVLIPNVDGLLNDIIIEGNDIYSINQENTIMTSCVENQSGTNIQILNNTILCIDGITTVNGVIKGNIIKNLSTKSRASAIRIRTWNPSEVCVIENNILNGHESCIGTNTSSDCTLTSLIIKNNYFDCNSNIGVVARETTDIDYIEIIGNRFKGAVTFTNYQLIADRVKYALNTCMENKQLYPFVTSNNVSHAFEDTFIFS